MAAIAVLSCSPLTTATRRIPTIEVFRHEDHYLARFSSPDVLETFEQDTLPTAYTAAALDVLTSVTRDNPAADVFLVGCSSRTLGAGDSARESSIS